MLKVKLDTGFNIEVEFLLAHLHKRFFAWLIDLFVQMAYLWLASNIIEAIAGTSWNHRFGWLNILYYLPVFFYHLASEIIMNGQSIGKKALSIKVIAMDGGQPSVSQYLLRWIFKIVDIPYWIIFAIVAGGWPWWTIVFLFEGFVCLVSTATSQRIGDLVAGTIIINTNTSTSWRDTVFTAVEDSYVPSFPAIMKMSDRDMNTVKQVLKTVSKSNDHAYAERIAHKIQTALHIDTNMNAVDFLETVLKDYNYLSNK